MSEPERRCRKCGLYIVQHGMTYAAYNSATWAVRCREGGEHVPSREGVGGLYAIDILLFDVLVEDARRVFDAIQATLGPVRGEASITEDFGRRVRIVLEAVKLDVETVGAAKVLARAVVTETLGAGQPRAMIDARAYGEHVRAVS